MTLKQEKLLEELPKTGYNLTRAAINVGYKENYANTKLHSDVRKSKILSKYFSEDSHRNRVKRAQKKFDKESDNSNYMRSIEYEGKLMGWVKDITPNINVMVDITNEARDLRSKYNIQ